MGMSSLNVGDDASNKEPITEEGKKPDDGKAEKPTDDTAKKGDQPTVDEEMEELLSA